MEDTSLCLFWKMAKSIVFFNMNIYDIARSGDSIIKIAGTLKHYLKNKDTTILFYPTIKYIEVKDQ
jgi:hypothetical protein